MDNKKVSVLIPSYNHAKFIGEAIESVLNQTYQNFEIVIVDDGSSDETSAVVTKFKDRRILYLAFQKNRGAAEANSEAYRLSSGDYICVLSSDDYWEVNKLRIQVDFLNANSQYGAVFSKAAFVDERGASIHDTFTAKHGDVFDQSNRSRTDWIRRFFFEGNCLCHPSVMIRRECYEGVGLYDNRLRQLPDFDLWIRFVKLYDIHILEDRLIYFRVLDREANASAPSPANQQRTLSELYLIGQKFFANMSAEDFKQAFSSELVNKNFTTEDEFDIEKALLLLRDVPWLSEMYNVTGYGRLYDLFQNPRTRGLLYESYNIDDLRFQEISSKLSTFAAPKSIGRFNTLTLIKELRNRCLRRGLFRSVSGLARLVVRS